MSRFNPEKNKGDAADKLVPETGEADVRIDGLEEKELLKRAEMKMGETLLENTLTLIENLLEKRGNKTSSKRQSAELRQDKNRLAAIREELVKNVKENQGDDGREEIAERIASELLARPYKPEIDGR